MQKPFWIVSGNMGAFVGGQKLETPADLGNYFRAVISEDNDVEITPSSLSDEVVYAKLGELYNEPLAKGQGMGGVDTAEAASDAEISYVIPNLEEAIITEETRPAA